VLIKNASDWLLDAYELFCPRHFRSSLTTTAQLPVLRPETLQLWLNSWRKQGQTERSSQFNQLWGIGAGEHFATAKKYSSSPPGVITNTKRLGVDATLRKPCGMLRGKIAEAPAETVGRSSPTCNS
jgi:hypothetical protein